MFVGGGGRGRGGVLTVVLPVAHRCGDSAVTVPTTGRIVRATPTAAPAPTPDDWAIVPDTLPAVVRPWRPRPTARIEPIDLIAMVDPYACTSRRHFRGGADAQICVIR